MFESVTLDQLTMLLAVVEEGSFSAAGRRLGRVQSAVSHAIATLEAGVGVQLFDRQGRAPTLTEEGARVLGEARLVLSQVRAFTQAAAELRAGVESRISIAVDVVFPESWLARALAVFCDAFPRVTVSVHQALLNEAVEMVVRGDASYGLCNVAMADTEVLVVRPVAELDLLPVCAADHPLAGTTAPQPMPLLQSQIQIVLAQREPKEPTEDQGVLSVRTWRVASLQTKLRLLLEGVGWGSLPWPMVRQHLASGRLQRLRPQPWPDGHRIRLHGIQRSDRPLGPAGRGFAEAISATAPPPQYSCVRQP